MKEYIRLEKDDIIDIISEKYDVDRSDIKLFIEKDKVGIGMLESTIERIVCEINKDTNKKKNKEAIKDYVNWWNPESTGYMFKDDSGVNLTNINNEIDENETNEESVDIEEEKQRLLQEKDNRKKQNGFGVILFLLKQQLICMM